MAVGDRHVIAGVTGSLRSLGALRAAEAQSRLTGGTLVAVLAWAPVGGEAAFMRAPNPILLELWEADARERMRLSFEAAFGGIPEDLPVQTMVVRASPGPLLVSVADQPGDLLVIGCGKRSLLSHAVHGSVARYCLAHASCPVLAVPPPELISALRRRRHHWRPEEFASPLSG